MIASIRHSAIVTQNIETLKKFYMDTLSFTLVCDEIEEGSFLDQVVGLEAAKIHVVKLKDPRGLILELLYYITPKSTGHSTKQSSNKLGHSHIAITVTDVETMFSKMINHGAQKINLPALNPSKTAKVCYIHDPDGNILELVQEI